MQHATAPRRTRRIQPTVRVAKTIVTPANVGFAHEGRALAHGVPGLVAPFRKLIGRTPDRTP
jgi:hypothetical protein